METIHSEPIILPNFNESDIVVLKKYFELNKKYTQKINEELTAKLEQDPLWGPLMKLQTPEQRKAQNERSMEMQRAAIYDGKWEEFAKDLITQGVVYARMNIAYADWYGIIKIYKDHLIPHIKKDFSSVEEAVTFIDGLSKFVDYTMYGIAEAYFKEKNNIIKANEERFRAIFENSTDNILLINKNADIIMVNFVADGVKKEDVIGKPVLSFQTTENAGTMKTAIHNVFENKIPFVFETEHENKGKKMYYSSSISPVFNEDGEVDKAVVISRDISAQKTAEIEVRELNASLEKRVNERTQELTNINKELESFSYSISHDLRSPLRAINGFAQILLEDYSQIMNEDAKDSMNEIIANAKRMGQLIDDLLEFSRLGKQNIIKTNVDMNELVESVITEFKSTEQGNRAEFNIKFLEKAKGEKGMLRQVMTNVISNAIKYSSKIKKPLIEIGSYKEGENNIYYIKDNGAGFDMAYYDKLFGVFQRLHSAYEFEGTGVGLAIVYRIVTKHGGKVWAEGKVGQGATFYLSLPYSN